MGASAATNTTARLRSDRVGLATDTWEINRAAFKLAWLGLAWLGFSGGGGLGGRGRLAPSPQAHT